MWKFALNIFSGIITCCCALFGRCADSLGAAPVSVTQLQTAYQRCQEACVEILLDNRHAGMGWFAASTGLVVTAGHLFPNRPAKIELLSPRFGRQPAELVAIHRGHELALLKTAPRAGGYPFLTCATSALSLGEVVYQYGAPLFRLGLLQHGTVAQTSTAFEYYGAENDYAEILYVSGMMQGGTSGGPWINRAGEVVGVQSGMMSLDQKPVGIAYLAPAKFIRTFLQSPTNALTPTLGVGVDEVWQQPREFLQQLPEGTTGLVVAKLHSNGPADQAGIQEKDVILSVAGQAVERIQELLRFVRQNKPGDVLKLQVLRPADGTRSDCTVTLGQVEAPLGKITPNP